MDYEVYYVGHIFQYCKMSKVKENKDRIFEVVKFIEQNLDTNLNLDELAAIACFSPFHFQRIFKELVGESPKQLIKRLRLEAAAHIIVLSPEKSMLEIALKMGFNSLEAFSRAFKDYYSVSPDTFRKQDEAEKFRITKTANLQRITLNDPAVLLDKYMNDTDDNNYDIQIVSRPKMRFIYMRTSLESPVKITENYEKVQKWALVRNYANPDSQIFGVIKDYPLFTALDKCRYLACISLDSNVSIDKSYRFEEIPGSVYASLNVKGGISELMKATSYFSHHWLPDSDYDISPSYAIHIPLKNPLTTSFDKNEYQVLIRLQGK